jgi:hypothetical protein
MNKLNGFVCSCHHGYKMVKLNISSEMSTTLIYDETTIYSQNSTTVPSLTPHLMDLRRHTCVDIDECQHYSTHQCTQLCENLKGTYACKCAANYIDTRGDGSICEATWREDSVVLVAYGTEIRQVRQNFSDYSYASLIEGQSFVLSMDVDPVERYVYWIDEGAQQIKRSFIPVSKVALGHAQLIVKDQAAMNNDATIVDFTALAVDWLAKNLYYAEGLNGTIKVCKADGRYTKTLISTNAERVYSLVINPVLGLGKKN